MGSIYINYDQMLAAKQVYKDTYNEVINAVYKECEASGVVDALQVGMQVMVKCDEGQLRRIMDRNSVIVRFSDILSVIVVTDCKEFVIDMLNEDVLMTILTPCRGTPMGALLTSTHTYKLDHLKITGVHVQDKVVKETKP